MCHMSHVIFWGGQSGEAFWWRVWYQRGLNRLVFMKTALHQVSAMAFSIWKLLNPPQSIVAKFPTQSTSAGHSLYKLAKSIKWLN